MVRNINPDFDIMSWRDEADENAPNNIIPKDQIWIDCRYQDEEGFLLSLYLAEQDYIKEYGHNFNANKFRKKLKKEFTWDGPKPKLSEFTVRKKRQGRFLIRFVDGRIVRQWIDPWFVFGGHGLVYKYIPSGEIWLDAKQDPREIKYVLGHEIYEWWLMSRGMRYDKAHTLATERERKLRVQELVRGKSSNIFIPNIVHHEQERKTSCGPACAKILLNYFHKSWSEKKLRELCKLDIEEGTDHDNLVEGLRKTGVTVSIRDSSSLSDLRKLLNAGLPVMVGIWSREEPEYPEFNPEWTIEQRKDVKNDCGHFAVVCGMANNYITLVDPARPKLLRNKKSGRIRMSISKFWKYWFDTDGPEYKLVRGWMLVINFDNRKFKGMKNYPPTAFPKHHDFGKGEEK